VKVTVVLEDDGRRWAGIRRHALAAAAVALMVPVTALATAAPAMAEPKGIFKIFKQCPTENKAVVLCNFAQTTSGEFVLGSTKVPINRTIVQQGGLVPTGNEENPREFYGVPAKNGESLSKTELNVPGGLLDFVNCEEIKGKGLLEITARALCKAAFENGVTGVTATSELVATETNPVIFNEFALGAEEGTALTLPLRVHLKNPLLGNSCYIGSAASPLELHLTDGETHPPVGFKPLRGTLGEPETLAEKEQVMLHLTKNVLVDNTFSAPGAEGCGELLFVKGFLDSIVDGKVKIPNKAGENEAVLKGELNAATSEAVIASEKF
jgi:hypothetical protein